VDLVQQVRYISFLFCALPFVTLTITSALYRAIYIFIQGFKFGANIEIFIPILKGSLHDLIPWFKDQREEVAQANIGTMFSHIFLRLHMGVHPLCSWRYE
jgi:hypothetical protein